jgi:hypothetical protein
VRTAAIIALLAAFSGCFGGDDDKQPPKPTATVPVAPLEIGQPRVMDYRTARVEVTPTQVEQGDIADFKGVRLDAKAKRSTPYYVTVSYKNVGKTTLASPSLSLNLWARSGAGRRAPKLTVVGGAPGPCENGDPPPSWKPGATLVDCSVFLLPKGEAPVSIEWRGAPDRKPAKWAVG